MEEQNKFPSIIELNVGGQYFTTSLLTLTKCPGNMLSAMFSGKYSTVCDKDGRYFIDADGANFIHILNFLRYGEIPGRELAEIVYREATYFGIQELIKALEGTPIILSRLQREQFRNSIPGFNECVEAILKSAQSAAKRTWTDIGLLLYKCEQVIDVEGFDKNHQCTCSPINNPKKIIKADARLGPWKDIGSSENEILECILHDLRARGFVATGRAAGTCDYSWNAYSCIKGFYSITFHWWQT